VVADQPTNELAASGSDTFTVQFTPSFVGMHTALVSIAHDDLTGGEDPYTFVLIGEGILGPAPTQHASNIVFSAITNVQMTMSWDNGNGANRIVVARQGSAITAVPIDGTTYVANAAFGSGDTITNGEFVVFNDSGTTVTVTALSPGTTYYFTIFEYNGSDGGINYYTDGTPASASQATYTYAPVIDGGASTNVVMSENGNPTPFSLTLNASDVDPGDTLTWSIHNAAFHGAASVSGTGASRPVSYTPPDYYVGTDSFVVRVTDSFGNTDTITVTVTITEVNKAGKTLFIFE
jgi:hypothetical protein